MTDHQPPEPSNSLERRIDSIRGRSKPQRAEFQPDLLDSLGNAPQEQEQADEDQPDTAPEVADQPKAKKGTRRGERKPKQGDFLAPLIYDVCARDSRNLMDVAPFKISKSKPVPYASIHYELPDGHVDVSSGKYGMGTVFDYDLVLMAISHTTEAMNVYRDGKGSMPSQTFRPHIGEVVKFMRKAEGGNQRKAIVSALDRLSTTHIKIKRNTTIDGKEVIIDTGEHLIGPYSTITNATTKKVEFIEFKLSDWMYKEITQGARPDVLKMHPDYFLSESGIVRFIYRLARKAAGKTSAKWSFQLVFERSGSTSEFKEFSRSLREIVAMDKVPEYSLAIENSPRGEMLVMVNRSSLDYLEN